MQLLNFERPTLGRLWLTARSGTRRRTHFRARSIQTYPDGRAWIVFEGVGPTMWQNLVKIEVDAPD